MYPPSMFNITIFHLKISIFTAFHNAWERLSNVQIYCRCLLSMCVDLFINGQSGKIFLLTLKFCIQ